MYYQYIIYQYSINITVYSNIYCTVIIHQYSTYAYRTSYRLTDLSLP